MSKSDSSAGLEECLKLLKGGRDEERLAGLLLATQLCEKNDHASITKIYDALGVKFLDRLLMTGIGRSSNKDEDERKAYMRLAIILLAGFCRVPELASSRDMINRVPMMIKIASERIDKSFAHECFEFFLLVGIASDAGISSFYESGGLTMLSSRMCSLSDDCSEYENILRVLQLTLSKMPLDLVIAQHATRLTNMVMLIAKYFAVLHSAVKFDSLNVLALLLSSNCSDVLVDALRAMPDDMWKTQIRSGIVAILQSRVVSSKKLEALILAHSMMSNFGNNWLVEPTNLEVHAKALPADRCLFLVLECSRVEVAVLLNELAYLKFEAPKSDTTELYLKKQNVAIAYSLIENIIQLISGSAASQDKAVSESSLLMVIKGLNETVAIVLEYLKDARDHGQKKGDDLLASVRVVGSYLAEAPSACNEKVAELLDYMFSIEGHDEPSPFHSICFLLPMVYQKTMEGCKLLVSIGGHKMVMQCFIKLIEERHQRVENKGSVFLACDVITNVLLMGETRKQLQSFDFVRLLNALLLWTEDSDDLNVVSAASCLCSLIFSCTTEESLLSHRCFDKSTLYNLSQLLIRSLEVPPEKVEDMNFNVQDIVKSGYMDWADRFPLVKETCSNAGWY